MKVWTDWIRRQVNADGSMRDPHLHSALLYSCHYTSYILGESVLEGEDFPGERTRRVWNFFKKIDHDVTSPSWEFNSFLLVLTVEILRQSGHATSFLDEAIDFLKSAPHRTHDELLASNNNFSVMELFVCSYLDNGGFRDFGSQIEALRPRAVGLEHDDGFLFDTTCPERIGIPSLVYHAKIAATLLLCGLLNDDDELVRIGKRGVDALLSLCPIERSMAYGRSQNSLFGFVNFYLAARLLEKATGQQSYASSAREIRTVVDSLQRSDGEHGINLANRNKQRDGFDSYMLPIVYNVYAWALMLFADRVRIPEKPENQNSGSREVESGLALYGGSGFYKVEKDRYRLYGNRKDYCVCRKYRMEPRYAPLTPTVVYNEQGICIPSILVRHRWYYWHDDRPGALFRRLVQRRLDAFRDATFVNNVDQAGLFPFFMNAWSKIVPLEMIRCDASADGFEAELFLRLHVHRSLTKLRLKKTDPDSYGTVSVVLEFNDAGLVFRSRIRLEKPYKGRLFHMNLRLCDEPVFPASERPGWFQTESGVLFRHEPRPSKLIVRRIGGSDKATAYLRAAMPCKGPMVLETETRIEFP